MSYTFYKVLHITAVMFSFLALGGLTVAALAGGFARGRKIAGITHGIALVVVLISGFGLLARLGVDHGSGFPPWLWGKLAIWLVLGGIIVAIRKFPGQALVLWILIPLLGATAAYLAIYKPGSGARSDLDRGPLARPAIELATGAGLAPPPVGALLPTRTSG